ncbi:MAG: hypothetical protein V4525_13250 [Pseudomonadota bacterium]
MKKNLAYCVNLGLLLLASGASATAQEEWNGQWVTTQWNVMSVCGTKSGKDIDAGPIWNNDDAKKRCPIVIAQWNQSYSKSKKKRDDSYEYKSSYQYNSNYTFQSYYAPSYTVQNYYSGYSK